MRIERYGLSVPVGLLRESSESNRLLIAPSDGSPMARSVSVSPPLRLVCTRFTYCSSKKEIA